MLDIYMDKMPNLAAEIDRDELARLAEGYVGWDIESLCKRATVNAIKTDAADRRRRSTFAGHSRRSGSSSPRTWWPSTTRSAIRIVRIIMSSKNIFHARSRGSLKAQRSQRKYV